MYSGWNHRIVRHKDDKWTPKCVKFGFHEVYYDAETGRPVACTEDSMIGFFESEDELQYAVEQMYNDVQKLKEKEAPVLDYEDFSLEFGEE